MKKVIVSTGLIMAAAFIPVLVHAEDAKTSAAPMGVEKAVVAAQTPATDTAAATAPVEVGNKICPVSGEKIEKNAMGDPVKIEHNGKMYNLCCPMCVKDFNKDPDKYAAIADKEVSEQAGGQK